ncbi:MAG: methylenetetrahydrofolate reductase C-terminal domain-containing protein [Oscillospiraceae bacterium]|jgi:Methylene-tetrahydrofolate reductase C terminal.|nr:methylenetetrahydrofolate reductase C-terminal domain-containing protein [Oscillospiraceae bacterium]MBQ5411936.1 methylenetetrahydrofolate reductase C-terminal domain-containing protein [Oscillospiraceae bacterium]
MLVTKLKDKDTVASLICGKAFIINCHGCKEVGFPEREAAEFQKELESEGKVTGVLTMDYICNPDNIALNLGLRKDEIDEADCVLVFSCGVGVQTVSSLLEDKRVYAACDTYAVPGGQGVTPLEFDCRQCGECYLNLTGGICPLTACSKGLVNGQCGGAKDGRCEVDPDMECGWERIQRRLAMVGRLDVLRSPVQIRNYDNEVNAAE